MRLKLQPDCGIGGAARAVWGSAPLWAFMSVCVAAGPLAQAQHNPPGATGTATLSSLQDAFSSVADRLEPAVVTIFTTKALSGREADALPQGLKPLDRGIRRASGTGSGVIIRADGWILTNDHVAGDADRVTVKLHDGREFAGTVLRDARSDLALVKIEANSSLPFAKLGDSDSVKIGHWAIAVGSPYKFEGTLSVGVISSLARRQTITDGGAGGRPRIYPDMIQTDASINPGNSGGPLCNLEGEVIGINTAIESDHSGLGGGGSIGIGFAIPINMCKFVINQLLTKGKVVYGLLGITPESVTPRTAEALKTDHGAVVEVEPLADSPAGKAGLHAGDVITMISGKIVKNELDLRTIVAQTAPTTVIDMTVIRDGKPLAMKATLEEAQNDVSDPPKPQSHGKASLGIVVEGVTKRNAEQAGFTSDSTGVLIKSVDATSSVADSDDFTEGCLIVRVNGVDTPDLKSYQEATEHLKSGDQVRILYVKPRSAQDRDLARHFIVVGVE